MMRGAIFPELKAGPIDGGRIGCGWVLPKRQAIVVAGIGMRQRAAG